VIQGERDLVFVCANDGAQFNKVEAAHDAIKNFLRSIDIVSRYKSCC
jgi:hypothetical protein